MSDLVEKRKAYAKEYRIKNREKVLGYQRKYKAKNREKLLEAHKDYYERNKGIIKEKHKKYAEDNKDRLRVAANNYKKKRKEESVIYFLWEKVKASKKRKTLPFDITFQDVEEVYPKDGLCPVFKVPLVPKDKKYTPTIDRIDSSLGYVKGNIQILSMLANKMKSDSTSEELLLFFKRYIKTIWRESLTSTLRLMTT